MTTPVRASARRGRGHAELLTLWDRRQRSPNVADAVYETLREAILRGVLPAGEPLAEVRFATLFQRSRTPVREAILRLESERLAERLRRRGLVVGRISREEVLEVYAVREVLDGLAARLAADGLLPTEHERLVWLNGRMRDAAAQGDVATMLRLNIEFHEEIGRASRNSFLLMFMCQIHDWVRRFSDTTFSFPGRSLEAVTEHDALLDALKRRDADEAERLAREHMRRARQVRVSMIQSSGQPV